MARAKKRTKAEKEERAKLYNQITSGDMMSSSRVNGNIIKSLHQKTDFGENDLGEDIEMDLKTLTEVMQKVSDKVKDGDLSNLEGMLVSQTYSLQHMFMTMASKVSSTTNPDHIDLFARFALKAQNQCRTTIATLSEMKNPKRATFIKQLNQANQMQVNNDDSDSEILKKNTNPANELLEQTDGERLDTRTAGETIGNDEAIATVEEINRPKDGSWQATI